MPKSSFALLVLTALPMQAFASSPGLVATERKDNDYSLEDAPNDKQVEVPEVVAKRILGVIEDRIREQKAVEPGSTPGKCATAEANRGPVFRIASPSARQLFVARIGCRWGQDLLFLLYDPARNAVTERPAEVSGRWMLLCNADEDESAKTYSSLRRPLVRFEDVDGDGTKELAVQERVHNGSVYNAIVWRYYEVGKDLSLTHVLALETHCHDLQGGEVVRSLRRLGPNKLRLEVEDRDENGKGVVLGHAVLSRAARGSAFRVSERYPRKQVREQLSCFPNALITNVLGCDPEGLARLDEDSFLRGESPYRADAGEARAGGKR